jgi:hypothetical protein
MARNRFVQPNTVRVDLTEGDWVELKEQISYAEAQRLYGAMVRTWPQSAFGVGDPTGDDSKDVGIDMARFAILRQQTWLTDWSFRDDQDKPVPLTRAAIENLDTETASEIDAAITAHQAAVQAKKAAGTNGKS